MSKHTKEPWPFFADWAEPSTPHPESEPIVRLGYDNYQRARYCVNACQGVSNGQLALTSVIGVTLMLKEAEQQRDELLAALAEIDGCFEAALIEGWLDAMANEDISRIKDIYCRRIDYARGIAAAALAGGAA